MRRRIQTWHKGHPGLAMVDDALFFVPEDMLHHVYWSVLNMRERDLVKGIELEWRSLEIYLATCIDLYVSGRAMCDLAESDQKDGLL